MHTYLYIYIYIYLRGQKCLLHLRRRPIELLRKLWVFVQQGAYIQRHTHIYIYKYIYIHTWFVESPAVRTYVYIFKYLYLYVFTWSEVSPACARAPYRTGPSARDTRSEARKHAYICIYIITHIYTYVVRSVSCICAGARSN